MAGDPRVQAMDKIRSALSGYAEGFTDGGVAARRALAALNAAAALSASPPAQEGAVVRVAVAMEFTAYENEIDRAYAVGWVHGSDEDMMRAACEGVMSDVVVPVGFADIRFTPPAKQEIAVGAVLLPASVAAAGEG